MFRRILVAGALALMSAPPAYASWDFTPTTLEWATWPEYCRVQYYWIVEGYGPNYLKEISPGQVEYWRGVVGQKTFDGLHHFCASIHFLSRARAEITAAQRNFALERAFSDAEYSYVRAERQSPAFPRMAVTLAQIEVERKQPDKAIEVLENTIQALPERPEAYGALASIYMKQRKLELARDTLRKGDAALNGESPDIQYNLGLINLELGDTEAAIENAKRAYAAGYPLDGLKRKLVALGKWQEPRKQ